VKISASSNSSFTFGSFEVFRCHGSSLSPWLADLAQLRIKVFREFPYLYDGTTQYEQSYLETYVKSSGSLVLIVRHGNEVVGASTALPLSDEAEEFRRPFQVGGIDPATVFYFGESIILPAYRGNRLGHLFFAEREGWAQGHPSIRTVTFAAVDRPADHPLKPPSYRPLHEFWKRLGYLPSSTLKTQFSWKDINEAEPSLKPMTFWTKDVLPLS
jgi:GNAT superfamily N-acetyltransferase